MVQQISLIIQFKELSLNSRIRELLHLHLTKPRFNLDNMCLPQDRGSNLTTLVLSGDLPMPSKRESSKSSASGDDQQPEPGTPNSLGIMWEGCRSLRRRVKDKKQTYMSRWVSPRAINVPSVKAMTLNVDALVCMAKWWCPTMEYPKFIPIDNLRHEVGDPNKLFTK